MFQPEQAAQSAPRQIPPHIPLIISAQTPEGETVQYVLSPAHNISAQQQTNAAPSGVRSTEYDNQPDPEKVAAYEREEEAFNAAIDALRRRAMEGAEILCIVTWPGDAAGDEPRETEVVRLPKRMIANPYSPKSNVELVGASAQERAVPDGSRRLVRSLYGVRATCGGDQVIRRQRRFQQGAASVFSAFLSLASSRFYCLSASQRVRGEPSCSCPLLNRCKKPL